MSCVRITSHTKCQSGVGSASPQKSQLEGNNRISDGSRSVSRSTVLAVWVRKERGPPDVSNLGISWLLQNAFSTPTELSQSIRHECVVVRSMRHRWSQWYWSCLSLGLLLSFELAKEQIHPHLQKGSTKGDLASTTRFVFLSWQLRRRRGSGGIHKRKCPRSMTVLSYLAPFAEHIRQIKKGFGCIVFWFRMWIEQLGSDTNQGGGQNEGNNIPYPKRVCPKVLYQIPRQSTDEQEKSGAECVALKLNVSLLPLSRNQKEMTTFCKNVGQYLCSVVSILVSSSREQIQGKRVAPADALHLCRDRCMRVWKWMTEISADHWHSQCWHLHCSLLLVKKWPDLHFFVLLGWIKLNDNWEFCEAKFVGFIST